MDFGASGFIPKTLAVEDMREAIATVLAGGVWTPADVDPTASADAETAAVLARLATLTPQQVRVLMMLSEGLLNKQIAYELGVSEATVKAHVSAILQKLGVESRTQAVIAAAKIEIGQITEDRRQTTGDEDSSPSSAAGLRCPSTQPRPEPGTRIGIPICCVGAGWPHTWPRTRPARMNGWTAARATPRSRP